MRALDIYICLCSYFLLVSINGQDTLDVLNLPKSTTEFGWNLLRKIVENSNENVFLSPLSLQIALTLVLQGASGHTATDLKTLLYNDAISDKTINENFRNINALLNTPANANYSLSLANKLYLQYGIKLKKPFESIVQEYYSGSLDIVDFVSDPKIAEKAINTWVNDQTKGKISSIVSDLTSDTILVIVNAIYFKGDWCKKFDDSKTKAESFTTITDSFTTVNMMNLVNEKFNYGEDNSLNCKIIELQYSGNDLSMFIILPNAVRGLYELENHLNFETLENLIANMDEVKVKLLKLPRLKLNMTYKLVPVLKSMGLNSLFSYSTTDLSAIYGKPGDIAVSDVIHKTFIEINEQGSEAAAASAVEITSRMGIINPNIFIANHPFIFFIRDNRSKLILFLGRITNPPKI